MNENMLRVLAEEPPPSRLDAEHLARAGRRRVRVRRAGAVGAVGAVTAVAIGAAAIALPDGRDRTPDIPAATASVVPPIQDAPCTVQALQVPRAGDITVVAMDASGRYILGMYGLGSTTTEGVLWVDGAPHRLPRPSGLRPGWTGVNGSRVSIGSSETGGRRRPWVYRNGTFTQLALPPGAIGGEPVAINDSGTIVGRAEWPGQGAMIGVTKAVRWQAGTPERVEVLASTTEWAEPYAVGADGTVVGSLNDGGRPYLWRPDGRGEPPPGLGADGRGKVIAVAGDFAAGWTVPGKVPNAPAKMTRWNLRTGTATPVDNVEVHAVAADGTVAGAISASGGKAALWRDGITYLLPVLSGTNAPNPQRISVDGRTVAGTSSTPAAGVPTVWKCNP